MAPSRAAVSPKVWTASGDTFPPATTSGTGPSVCALRRQLVEWSAVTATIVLSRSSASRRGAKKRESISSMLPILPS